MGLGSGFKRASSSTLRVAVGSPYVTAPSGGSRAYDFLAVGVSAAGDAIVSGYVTVTGAYRFHTLTPFVGALLGDPINMQVQTSALAG